MLALYTALALLAAPPASWTSLGAGVEYRRMALSPTAKEPDLHVVRVDPEKARLVLGLSSREKKGPRTAAAWADELKAVAVINAGMFDVDRKSNVGRLVDLGHVNRREYNAYRSALLLNPKREGLPRAQLVDLEDDGRALAEQYHSVVQNLRLIKGPGVSVWGNTERAWSEAAIAQDRRGRILFLFTRAPRPMSLFNQQLLVSDLEVVRALHAEGGPEASLSVRGAVKLDLCGSFESGFLERDDNGSQWDLPNVLAVLPGP